MIKDFLKDNNSQYSSMRLTFLVCTFLSSILTVTSLIAVFHDKDISQILNAAIAFMTIGTAGKTISKKYEVNNE